MIVAAHNLVKIRITVFQQRKGVSIIVVGVGKNVRKEKGTMSKIAGKKGKVLLYPNFDDLPGHLDDIVKAKV